MSSTKEQFARLLVVWVGVLTVMSFSVVTAGVALAFHGADDCGESGLAAHPDAADRGAYEIREPVTEDSEEVPAEHAEKGNGGFHAVVPTYVHVISPDGVEAMVPPAKIREQVRVLTLSFGGFYGGVDTGFEFQLQGIDYTVNADWYAGPDAKGEKEMKQALRQGGPDALNVYLTTAGPFLGWAWFPKIVKTGQAYLDGIVVDWKSLPRMGFYPEFDLGFTATHEAGHWLNLYHTFQGGCKGQGDYVDDTPAQATPTFGCPEGKDTCTAPGTDPIHNYMDYSDDPCYNQFTAGQSDRMQDAWSFWRA